MPFHICPNILRGSGGGKPPATEEEAKPDDKTKDLRRCRSAHEPSRPRDRIRASNRRNTRLSPMVITRYRNAATL